MPEADDVRLVAYDPTWPQQFRAAELWLRQILVGGLVQRVEHSGSTAIPGMPAKPVIDMLVQIPSFEEALRGAVSTLRGAGCEYFWRDDRPPGHMMFIRRESSGGRRNLHVHMAPAGHKLWERVAFRDYLIAHPDEAQRYADLKQRLMKEHPHDREAYTEGKSALVRELTERATSR